MAHTAGGMLFLSTGNGIYTFNGYDLQEIPIDKEYRKHFFRYLHWDEKHSILLGYNSEDYLYQILPELKAISKTGGQMMRIASANDTVFLTTHDGEMYSVMLPSMALKKIQPGLHTTVNCVLKQGNFIYTGTGNGLYKYDLRAGGAQKISSEVFIKLKIDPYSGRLYGITGTKAFMITDRSTEKFAVPAEQKAQLSDIEFTGHDDFYLSGNKGLYHCSKGRVTQFTTSDALASNALNLLFYNRYENCLFVSTGDKGLMRLQFKSGGFLYEDPALPKSSIASIIKTSDDKVLFAQNCCNVGEIRKDTMTTYSSYGAFYSVLGEIDKKLLCGTWGAGIKVMNRSGTVTDSIMFSSPDDNILQAVYKDRNGSVWIGTMGGVLRGNTAKNARPYLRDVIRSRINTIYGLQNGNICLGGPEGVFIISGNNIITTLGKKNGLVSNAVRSFYEDKEGKLWIGTYAGGLYCYASNKLTCINAKKGCMLFSDAFCLAPDAMGNLYMTSNYGLWSIKLKALDDFYKNKTSFLVPAHYTEENGLLNTEFNGGFQNNYLQYKKDHFYFPSIEGILEFNADTLPFRKLKPVIESVTVNDSSTSTNSGSFARNTFLLKFKVSCVNFSLRNNVFFQYKLTGSSSDEWSLPQKENFFNFYLLTPGEYKLTIRAIDAFNDTRPTEAVYEFTIQPYFYETLWFKIFAGILFIMLVIFISVARIRRHQKKAAEKEFYARRIAEIELKAVQAQLNPHFIFNCLNTIKFFILDHDFEKANKGLNHFSKLLRDVLHNSENQTITLHDKIKFLTGYLELEKMRLQDQLEYTITSDIENGGLLIPTMIIQLHVENAIKHGIANLENRKGVLLINFTKKGAIIECTITDNGIGRVASLKLNRFSTHKSVGIRLIKDQTDILKKMHNIEIVTTITDLHSDSNGTSGTQVEIKIPIQYETGNN